MLGTPAGRASRCPSAPLLFSFLVACLVAGCDQPTRRASTHATTPPDNGVTRSVSYPLLDGVTVTDLGTLPGGSSSWAQGINAAGHVVGYSHDASGRQRAFLWTANGGMRDL